MPRVDTRLFAAAAAGIARLNEPLWAESSRAGSGSIFFVHRRRSWNQKAKEMDRLGEKAR